MRRDDLLNKSTTAIAPALEPQALMADRSDTRTRRARGLTTASRGRATPRAAPVVLVALVCILLAFV
jgi:hypothetical protein